MKSRLKINWLQIIVWISVAEAPSSSHILMTGRLFLISNASKVFFLNALHENIIMWLSSQVSHLGVPEHGVWQRVYSRLRTDTGCLNFDNVPYNLADVQSHQYMSPHIGMWFDMHIPGNDVHYCGNWTIANLLNKMNNAHRNVELTKNNVSERVAGEFSRQNIAKNLLRKIIVNKRSAHPEYVKYSAFKKFDRIGEQGYAHTAP